MSAGASEAKPTPGEFRIAPLPPCRWVRGCFQGAHPVSAVPFCPAWIPPSKAEIEAFQGVISRDSLEVSPKILKIFCGSSSAKATEKKKSWIHPQGECWCGYIHSWGGIPKRRTQDLSKAIIFSRKTRSIYESPCVCFQSKAVFPPPSEAKLLFVNNANRAILTLEVLGPLWPICQGASPKTKRSHQAKGLSSATRNSLLHTDGEICGFLSLNSLLTICF